MARRTVGHALQKPRGSGTSRLKLSSLTFLAVSIPALAIIALMFVAVSVAPNDGRPKAATNEAIKLGQPKKQVARIEEKMKRAPTFKFRNNTASTAKDGVEYHIVFSTGCSIFQDWQSYVFFYFAMVRDQPGTVTRIVSGCSDGDQATLQKLFDDQIATMVEPGRFQIHFTPDFSRLKPGILYKYWNKPFGTKHWMEKALGFPKSPVNENAIVILMDPDQMIVRPFRNNDFSHTIWAKTAEHPSGGEPRSRIEHGKPMGQKYGFRLQWKDKINMKLVLPEGETTPIDEMSNDEALQGYVVGPPYIATARDMYAIVTKWTEFALPVHDQYPHLLAEMFAYCLAAAHLRLAHQIAASFMVSDTGSGNLSEGWSYIDNLDASEMCKVKNPDNLPNVFHFCQRYAVGYWFFGKYRLPKDFLTCEHPLFREPPSNFMEAAGGQIYWPGGGGAVSAPHAAKRNAFMTCHMLRALNDAAEYYKKRHCPGTTGNLNRTYTFFSSDKYSS